MGISPERDELWQRLPAARVPLQLPPGALPLVQRKGRALGWQERGIPGDGASRAPSPSLLQAAPSWGEQRAAPNPPGLSGAHGTPSTGRGSPHHPIHGHTWGQRVRAAPRGPGQAWGRTRASDRPPGQGEAAPIPRGDRALGRGKPRTPAPRAPGTEGMRPAERSPPASAAPHGEGPTQPCPHRGGTPRPRHSPLPSSLTAGRGDLPVPGGGGGGSCAGGRAGEGGGGGGSVSAAPCPGRGAAPETGARGRRRPRRDL